MVSTGEGGEEGDGGGEGAKGSLFCTGLVCGVAAPPAAGCLWYWAAASTDQRQCVRYRQYKVQAVCRVQAVCQVQVVCQVQAV